MSCKEETGQFELTIKLALRTGLATTETYLFTGHAVAPGLAIDAEGYLTGTVNLDVVASDNPVTPAPPDVKEVTWNCTILFEPPLDPLSHMQSLPPIGPDEVDSTPLGAVASASPPRSALQKATTYATTYATAVARWIAAGFPRRSDDEVDQIFEICRACKWMHAAGYCQKCGCRLSKSRQAMTNKIRMATEHCPLPDQKW